MGTSGTDPSFSSGHAEHKKPVPLTLALLAPLLSDQLRTCPHPRLTQTLLPRVKLVKFTDSSYLKT